ncbi:permease [bacterium]|nr:permease [bacterium]
MKIFDSNFWIVFGLLIALAGLAFGRGGTPLLSEALGNGARLFVRFGLVILLSFLVAGLAESLMPREWVSSALGEESGWRGLLLASAAGAITPAGPFVSMPIALTLLKSGAAPASVITFLSAWSLLAIHRLFAWEIPILGSGFALTRWSLCLVLPVIVGAASRLLVRS